MKSYLGKSIEHVSPLSLFRTQTDIFLSFFSRASIRRSLQVIWKMDVLCIMYEGNRTIWGWKLWFVKIHIVFKRMVELWRIVFQLFGCILAAREGSWLVKYLERWIFENFEHDDLNKYWCLLYASIYRWVRLWFVDFCVV